MAVFLPARWRERRPSFLTALWLVPAVMAAHNAEEYPAIIDFVNRHGWRVDKTQMFVAIILAMILPVPVVAAATRSSKGSRRLILALALQGALAINALGHLGQTLWYRDYSPGTLTGLGLNVPLAAYIYKRAVGEGYLFADQARRAAVLGAVLLVRGTLGLQVAGRLITSILSRDKEDE